MYAVNSHVIKIDRISKAEGKLNDVLQFHRGICLFPNFKEVFDEF
jgi:hypothetical protein